MRRMLASGKLVAQAGKKLERVTAIFNVQVDPNTSPYQNSPR